ncbi:MAG: hypothetical protein J6S96_04295 [Muribaculaceae bacterium]|nr:hypothetical protein [Muribaculaceae bacterium]
MNDNSQVLDLRRHWRALRRGWWLYLIALLTLLGLATYYALNKQEQYRIQGLVLIEDEKESAAGLRAMGGMAQMMRTFSIGGFSSSVDNEMAVIASHDVRERVARALSLNRTYVLHTGLLTRCLMYHDSPIKLDAPDEVFDTMSHSLKVNVHLHDGKADIAVRRGRFTSASWKTKDATLPCKVVTPYGEMQLLKTALYDPAKDIKMDINVASNNEIAEFLHKQVKISIPSKKGDAIKLTLKDNRERGLDIINAMVAAYNEKRNERRNERAQAEVDFVNNRLALLQQDLADVEGRVTRFKQANNVNNPILEAQGWLKQSAEAQAEAAAAQGELTTYEMILNTLRGTDEDAMLPAFEGVKDPSVVQYNELVAKRSTLAQSATAGNVALDALDKQIKPLRESIIKRAEKNIDAARIKLNSIYALGGRAQGRYNQMPQAEQQYYDLLRDRELKNDLYVFLLEKKESSLLKMNANSSPAFILDHAYSGIKTDKTKAIIVFVIALLLGLLLPTLFLLWRMKHQDLIEEPCDLSPELEPRSIIVGKDDVTALASSLFQFPAGTTVHVANFTQEPAVVNNIATELEKQGVTVKVEQPTNFKQYTQTIDESIDQQRWLVLPDAEHASAYLRLTSDEPIMAIVQPKDTCRKSVNKELAPFDPKRCLIVFLDN